MTNKKQLSRIAQELSSHFLDCICNRVLRDVDRIYVVDKIMDQLIDQTRCWEDITEGTKESYEYVHGKPFK